MGHGTIYYNPYEKIDLRPDLKAAFDIGISRVEEKLERGSKNIASMVIKYTMSPPIKLAL